MLSRNVLVVVAASLLLACLLIIAGCATETPSAGNSTEDAAAIKAKRDAAETAAEKERQAALEKLLAESPALSQQGLAYDVDSVGNLTAPQQEALLDAGSRVSLTTDEERELASITPDQWYALTQLAAFYSWLAGREQEKQADDQTRAIAMQTLVAKASMKQAEAIWVQAGAEWWHERCTKNRSQGQACY